MGIADLRNVMHVFGGGEPDADAGSDLFREVALMTLSRATSSDSNIQSTEVSTVQRALSRLCGQNISEADIRVAARSELYERATIDKYLSKSAKKIAVEDRVELLNALADVIKADVRVSEREIEFFNKVAGALQVSPAELAGLVPDPV